MLPESAIEKFRASLLGQSFCPGEQGYDAARAVPNAMIDRRPAIIARCADAGDVIACVRFAREHDLLVSVRGGGHSIAGKAVCDGGLMIDLACMKGIHVDPHRRTVRAEPGLTLGEFDHETQVFGLATCVSSKSDDSQNQRLVQTRPHARLGRVNWADDSASPRFCFLVLFILPLAA